MCCVSQVRVTYCVLGGGKDFVTILASILKTLVLFFLFTDGKNNLMFKLCKFGFFFTWAGYLKSTNSKLDNWYLQLSLLEKHIHDGKEILY